MYKMGKTKPQRVRSGTTTQQSADDESQLNYEQQVRFEIRKLKRQFRMMENARSSIAGQSNKLSIQGAQVQRLQEENKAMLADIQSLRSKAIMAKDQLNFETIEEAVDRYAKHKEEIEAVLLDLVEMEFNVQKIIQQLVVQKLKIQADYGQSMTVAEADHRKRVLENRLYHLTTQFDTLVYQNKQFKEEINTLLILRGLFFKRMITMQRLTVQQRKKMKKILYEAKHAYKERDEYISEITMLVKRNTKEIKKHVFDIKELQRILLQDYKNRDFLLKKNRLRDHIENEAHRYARKNAILNGNLDALLAAYKKAFKAVLRMGKCNDIESVVNDYVEIEERNYADFRFCMDLNREIDKEKENIDNVIVEIEAGCKIFKQKDIEQEDTISEIDKRIDSETEEYEAALVKLLEAEANMEQFGALIEECFNICGCSKADITNLFGDSSGMQPIYICLCLKMMERRVIELIFEKRTLKLRQAVEIYGNSLPKKVQMWETYKEPEPRGGPYKVQTFITGAMLCDQEDQDGQDLMGRKAWSEEPIYYDIMKKMLQQKAALATAPPSQMFSTISSVDTSISTNVGVAKSSQLPPPPVSASAKSNKSTLPATIESSQPESTEQPQEGQNPQGSDGTTSEQQPPPT